MEEKYLINYSEGLKKRLSKISNSTARKFLYKYGYNSSSFAMPDYYQAIGFNKIKLKKINWKKVPKTQTLDIFTPKGNLSWRRFSFFHPYMYWHIVNVLTEEKNWEKIKKYLCQTTIVGSYSVPDFTLAAGQTVQGQSIERWLQMAERDLIKDCANYNCLAITDIQNFYSSIYTHSIAWALHSKERARADRWKRKLVGNKLDKLFQNSRDTQTNGIPIGSMASDIIAEIVLTKIDILLTRWVKNEKLDSTILVSRFRDDYRILSKNSGDANKFLKGLNRILHDNFDLILNPNKTYIYEDVIEKAYRPWDLEIKHSYLLREIRLGKLPKKISFYFLKDVLLETYQIQKKYSQGRAAISVFSNLAKKLNGKKIEISASGATELIAILRKIVLVREEVTPYSTFLIDALLDNYNIEKKKQFIKEMASVVNEQPDADYQLIWLYRLCLSQAPEFCKDIVEASKIVSPLLNLVHKHNEFQRKKNYCDIFSNLNDVSEADKDELKKFRFLNITKLRSAKRKKITPLSISLFKYEKIIL